MRKRFRVLLIAAIAAAVVVPVGFALSLEPGPVGVRSAPSPMAAIAVNAPMAFDAGRQAVIFRSTPPVGPRFPDSAGLLVLGTVLIGVAVAVRRAS
jgi:hypothetical protein